MDHSKVIETLKGMPRWRFILIWVWLMAMAVSPAAWLLAVIAAWLAKR
jgi:hypothetical protein